MYILKQVFTFMLFILTRYQIGENKLIILK
jgi:hypothetical protein